MAAAIPGFAALISAPAFTKTVCRRVSPSPRRLAAGGGHGAWQTNPAASHSIRLQRHLRYRCRNRNSPHELAIDPLCRNGYAPALAAARASAALPRVLD